MQIKLLLLAGMNARQYSQALAQKTVDINIQAVFNEILLSALMSTRRPNRKGTNLTNSSEAQRLLA